MCSQYAARSIKHHDVRRLKHAAAVALAIASSPMAAFGADCVNGVNAVDCTVPAGATSVFIQAWGAGGGAEGQLDGYYPIGLGGGGGGSYCGATFAVTPGTTLTVYPGIGGDPGTDGEDSFVTGTGVSGMQANGGMGAFGDIGGSGGAVNGCSAAGATKYAGGDGADGYTGDNGGGGGGSATAAAAGGNASASTGGVGQGNGGLGAFPNLNQRPTAGNSPGGGGGGGDSDFAGMPGADGRIMMTFSFAPPTPTSVPTLNPMGLFGLIGLLALLGLAQTRKHL
jgi:hypothetical protein